MAIRNILDYRYDLESLRKTSRQVTNFDKRLHTLLDDMADTLRDAQGVGLAAPQVGVLRQVCIVLLDDEEGVIELINPTVLEREGEQEDLEGCLSFPGLRAYMKRPLDVTVRAQDRNGKSFEIHGTGLKARAFLHEIDHLNGVCLDMLVELRPESEFDKDADAEADTE
jgi:peptide deformylase